MPRATPPSGTDDYPTSGSDGCASPDCGERAANIGIQNVKTENDSRHGGKSGFGSSRAQTTIDFAIGISVFLLAVAFVFTIIPGTLDPLLGSAQEETVAVDRVASQLAEGTLGDPSTPYVLDVGCTTYFFGGPTESGCKFDSDDYRDWIGLRDGIKVNVQLLGDDVDDDGKSEVLCNDGSGTVDEETEIDCDTLFEVGDSPPDGTGSVMVARRVVSIDGTDATLRVRTW